MRRLTIAVAVLAFLACASPAGAAAELGGGLPLAVPATANGYPPGFSTTAAQAMALAKATPAMQALHRRMHPLWVQPLIWAQHRWVVDFSYRGKLVGEVDIAADGKVTGAWTGAQAKAVYTRGDYAPLFSSWWVLVPSSLLFLLPFFDPRRLRRLAHLDALAVLSFLVSFLLFDNGHLEAAVWLAYPPLVYLLIRMLAIGFRRAGDRGRPLPVFSARTLGIGLLLLVAARVTLSLVSGEVIDVGYASVIGAHHIAHGQSLYLAASWHGDTYGPIAYLAYLPFEALFPWHGSWDYLPSAHAASIVFDLVTVFGLITLGRRLRSGSDGLRLGLAFGWAWAACPFTLMGMIMHTNDGLISMFLVLSLVVFSSAPARGAMLALAAAAKFSPAALLPLYASPRSGGRRQALACVAAFVVVAAVAIGLYLPPGGISEFYRHTIGYQLTRHDVFSPWALHPGLDPLKTIIEAAALVLVAGLAFVPRERSPAQVAALAGAAMIAIQLPAVHWFYYYILWFAPFAIVAILVDAAPEPVAVTSEARAEGPAAAPGRLAPRLSGA